MSESSRVDGKPRRRVVRSLGTAHSRAELEHFHRLGAKVIEAELAKQVNGELLFDASEAIGTANAPTRQISDFRNLKETNRVIDGIDDIFGSLFDSSGFGNCLPAPTSDVVKSLVLARIAAPSSKRKTQKFLKDNELSEASLNTIYRSMDKLFAKTEQVNECALLDAKSLFDDKIDLVLFDVTTLYFESVEVDELRSFGFSKDQKFHQTQVVLAMGVTREGLPIGYKLFPGNTAETKTLVSCLDGWKKHVSIGRVVFVADRGMFNSENLRALDDSGYEFVVGAKLRQLKSDMASRIFEFKKECMSSDECTHGTRITSLPHTLITQKRQPKKGVEEETIEGRLVVSFNEKRRKKDKSDRDKILDKISKLVGKKKNGEAKKLVSNKGYLKFSKIEGQLSAEIDKDKVARDEQWDGLHGLFSNAKLTEEEIHDYYRQLWTIEETFRVGKTDLEMRPIYHFKPERICAHISICFVALYLVRKAQLLFKRETGQGLSVAVLQEELNRVQTSHVLDRETGFRFKLPSNMRPLAREIYKVLGVKRSDQPTAL
ncbi:MAG: IS1634 family transposase [bacterium]